MNRDKMRLWLLTLVFGMFLIGCAKKPVVEGYRVVSFDPTTGKWIILRNGTFDGTYLTKRITAVCDFYKWGDHETIRGPNACTLHVGQMMVPLQNRHGERDMKNGLYVFEDPDRLSIIEGDGENQVSQQFFILKNEIVSE